jgi:MoaA/NifB/PqqE/SkfB family radical SAM enzyme
MNLKEILSKIETEYDVITIIELNQWRELPFYKRESWLKKALYQARKDVYQNKERIVLTLTVDYQADLILEIVERLIFEIDISDFFVTFITNLNLSSDRISIIRCDNPVITVVDGDDVEMKLIKKLSPGYISIAPEKRDISTLTNSQANLLLESETFCMYPWIHLHAYPTGEAWPCCHAERSPGELGSCREQSLQELWNSPKQKQLRKDMLAGVPNSYCIRCYEREKSGFFSGRQCANKHHGHHINRVDHTKEDGHLDQFEMTYWDIRFSNLCNLKCRSCGHIFSSTWYQDQVALAGPDWGKKNKPLQIAGRYEGDLFQQLLEHVDRVEQIYFAGGEPLMMEEHYAILDELEKRNMFHVRLIYNTNFTKTKFKDREVFDYWRKFKSVSVGASLDAMGPRAEYIRSGTKWETIESNRKRMMEICPEVDFYVSATLSIMNALHLPDFHREWVDKGFIRGQDFNVNILQDPAFYRIDIAPQEMKKEIEHRYIEHLLWLKGQDHIERATNGFESAIRYMNATDNSYLIGKFWERTLQLDELRNECIYDYIPELKRLHND